MPYERPSFWQWRASTNKKNISSGSPADGYLQRGDIVTKIGSYDSRDIRHQDAQNLFRNAGSNVRVVVQREHTRPNINSTGSSRTSSYNNNYSPLSVSPHLSPKCNNLSSPYSPAGSTALTPYYSTPMTPIDQNYFDPVYYTHPSNLINRKSSNYGDDDEQDLHVTKQPYRTTPLVLPGAKIKHEPGPTESYLRHHPNPAVRARPHHFDEHLLKKKVANSILDRITTGNPNKQIVHKQFNSPINVYSEPAIMETIQKQTGVTPVRKQVKFNPAESETYKAIQEEEHGGGVQEINVPPQSRVFQPHKNPITKQEQHQPSSTAGNLSPYASTLGESEEPRQSGSFKRLMWSVLPETSY